jgi:hypothetical protein
MLHSVSLGQLAGKTPKGTRRAALNRPPGNLLAGWVRVITASDTVVVARRYDRCADGSGTNAHADATAYLASAISFAAINTSDASTARLEAADTATAPIRQGISRNARDAKHGDRSNGNDSSVRHGTSLLRLFK